MNDVRTPKQVIEEELKRAHKFCYQGNSSVHVTLDELYAIEAALAHRDQQATDDLAEDNTAKGGG